ncbi:MAG: ATP-binding protein, partial [Myxococcota bacterium]
VVAALGAGGALPWDRDAAPLSWWLMAAGSVVCVSLFVGLSTLALMESLEGALRDAVTANEAAEREIAVRKQAEAEREALQTQVAFAQKMELVGQLAGGLAHDLNNLLTVVQVEGTLARDVAGDATVVEGLDHLLEATQSASALCDRLLHFARPGFGRSEPQRIDERIAHMLPLLRSLAGERVTLVTGLSAPEARITADPVELEQILTNLVANARDAMPGGGRISITTRVAVDDGGPRLLMSVSDGGTGMDEATLRRVFEPFFTTKSGRGTGLGLATVYAIIHSMDGEIDVRSVVGRGSTFVLQLPLSSTPEVHCALQVPRPGLALPRSPVKVLVVEDNPIVRSVVVRVLEASGCTVVAEAGVPAALDRLRRDGVPDLVVTDVLMPGPSGADLAEAVRATLPETPILAMTGWMGDGELAMRLEALDVPILRKPFAPTDLVDAVGALLSRSPVMMLPE